MRRGHPPWGVISHFLSLCLSDKRTHPTAIIFNGVLILASNIYIYLRRNYRMCGIGFKIIWGVSETNSATASIFFFLFRGFCYRACVLTRQTERDRERESEKSPPREDGHVSIPSPPFSSHDLGYTCTCVWHEFKPPGLGLEPRSTTWESSNIAITLTAGPDPKS